ncbi:MAG: efflux RND transporter periplasmic adaptor subunit [Pseudomonadota bacterium]
MKLNRARLRQYGLITGGLAVVMAFAWIALTQGPMAPVRVTVAPVARGDLQPAVFGIGTVEARHAYAIGPTQPGRLLAVHVDQGDVVKAGQVLAEMDPVDLDQRLAAADSARARAVYAVEMAAAQAREAASRAQLAGASAARYRELTAKGFVSRDAGDAKAHEAAAARAAAEAAQAALAAAQRDLARAGAERDSVARQRSHQRLVSPVDGIVIAREAEPGSTLVAGQAALRVVDGGSLWLRARIEQSRVGGIEPGQPAEILLRSRGRQPLPGRVARVELASDAVTEERVVNIAFAAEPGRLSIGELAEVTIRQPVVPGALFVPSAAVRRMGGEEGVWRVIEGRTRFVPVRTGVQTLDGRTQILSGLAAGDQVVLYTAQELRAGLRVTVAESLARM